MSFTSHALSSSPCRKYQHFHLIPQGQEWWILDEEKRLVERYAEFTTATEEIKKIACASRPSKVQVYNHKGRVYKSSLYT